MYKQINYEQEVEADTDIVEILFSKTLRALPLEGLKTKQTIIRSPVRAQSQRMIFSKIHKDSRSLWGSY